MTYRDNQLIAPVATKSRTPFLWALRVWWASRGVTAKNGVKWTYKFTDIDGSIRSVTCGWSLVTRNAERWERVPAGDVYAIPFDDGTVWIVKATHVPTLARLARRAADAWEWSKAIVKAN